jgi:hypothetical protein
VLDGRRKTREGGRKGGRKEGKEGERGRRRHVLPTASLANVEEEAVHAHHAPALCADRRVRRGL